MPKAKTKEKRKKLIDEPWRITERGLIVVDSPGSPNHCELVADCYGNVEVARLMVASRQLLKAATRLRDCPDVQMDNTEPETDAARLEVNKAIKAATGK